METLGVLFFIGCILIGAGVITLLRSNKIMAVFNNYYCYGKTVLKKIITKLFITYLIKLYAQR